MFKKVLSGSFLALMLVAFLAGCSSPSGGGKVVEDFTVTADYSQITVNWTPKDEETVYYVYAGQNKNERPQEWVFSGSIIEGVTCKFTVEETGLYYVWIQTEEDGPVSEPKSVEVKFIDPVTNVTATRTILGFKVSWTNPTKRDGVGSVIQVGYKKAGGEWKYKDTNSLAGYMNINGIEDGTYTFKVLIWDKYNAKVASPETGASAYAFDTSYGQQPSCSRFETSTTIRDITDDSNTPVNSNADYYYINATKGERYTFDVLDYDSYELARISQGSWGSISSGDFITAKVSIYISGACPLDGSEPDPLGLVESKSYFKPNHELYFTCERDAYYVIKVEKTSRSSEGATDYGLSCRTYN